MTVRIACTAAIGIVLHGIISLELHERWRNPKSLMPALIALILGTALEVGVFWLLGG